MTTSSDSTNIHHSDMTFQQMADTIYAYLKERDWQVQPPRDIAVSISLEASELLEHFQWNETPTGSKDDLASELADVLIYSFQFAALQGIDIPRAMQQKLEKSAKKYPAHVFKGKGHDERQDAWLQAKLAHRKEGL
jgi:dCTP diphosphatase